MRIWIETPDGHQNDGRIEQKSPTNRLKHAFTRAAHNNTPFTYKMDKGNNRKAQKWMVSFEYYELAFTFNNHLL